MADTPDPNLGRASAIDAALAIAKAAECNAVALIEVGMAIRELVEHIREQADTPTAPGRSVH